MKKIFYIFPILFVLVGTLIFSTVQHANAVPYAGGGIMWVSPNPSSPTQTFKVFTALFGCPKYPIYDTDPNVTIMDTVDASQVAQALKITNPSGRVLVSPQDYTYSISSAGNDPLGWPLANYVVTLNSTSSVGTYKINATMSAQYNCPFNQGYVGTDYYFKNFVYNPSITTPPPAIPLPQINSLTATPSPVLRSNWTTLTWSSNADSCVVGQTGNTLYPDASGNFSSSFFVRPDGNTDSESVSTTIMCQNSAGTTEKTISVSQFHDLVHFNGYTLRSCADPVGSAVAMSPNDPNVSFDATITSGPAGTTVADYPTANLSNTPPKKTNDFTWGPWDSYYPSIFSVTGKKMVPPAGYQYCSNSGDVKLSRTSPALPAVEKEIDLYFAPVGATTLTPPTNFGVIPECHQNDPQVNPAVTVQELLGWSPVSGAISYKIYNASNNQLIASTANTYYLNFNLAYNTNYSYYITSVDSSGNESSHSNTVSATTPLASQCTNPPPPPSGATPTYIIIPVNKTINVGQTAQYTGLYDPDGGGGNRYGNFDVTSLASWKIITPPNIANSLGAGAYNGTNPGGASNNIGSTYTPQGFSGINANATLNVNSVSNPDFSISITPSINTVTKPGSAIYAVNISSLNGFSGDVSISASGLHGTTTASFSPSSINTSGNSDLTLTIGSSAVDERYTFTVTGQSGSISHSTTADLIVKSVVPPSGGLSCVLSADTNSPPNISFQSITGGSGGYVCNFPSQEQGGFPIYSAANCTNPYPSGCTVQGTCTINASVFDNNGNVPHNSTSCNIVVNGSGPGTGNPSLKMYIQDGLNGGQGTVYGNINNLYPGGFGAQYTQGGKYFEIPPLIVPYNYSLNSYPIKLSWVSSNTDNCVATSTTQIQGWSGSKSSDSNGEIDYVQVPPNPGQRLHNEPVLNCSGIGRSMYADIYRCAQNDTSKYSATCQSLTPASCTFTASPSSILTGQSSILSWACDPTGISRNCVITKVSDNSIVATGTEVGAFRVKPMNTTQYNLSCDGAPTVADTQATVKVGFIPVIREIIPR